MEYTKAGIQKQNYNINEVELRDCPVCGCKDFLKIYQERGAVGVVRCKNCDFIYVNPMVKDPGKNYWGDEDKYLQEAMLILKGLAPHHRDPNYLDDLKVIEYFKPKGNFLDIGSNMGFFLRHASGGKWNIFGVEPSPALAEIARKYFNLNVKTAYLDDAGFDNEFFDVVTMTDVFEHIENPNAILQSVKKVIKKCGILFVKVPNGRYNLLKLWFAKIIGNADDYDIFDSYEHVSHFTAKTLRKVLENNGFKIKKFYIGRPIQLPAWHKYVGQYYQYPSPWYLDAKSYILRISFYWVSKFERLLRFGDIGYFAPNIIVIAEKE